LHSSLDKADKTCKIPKDVPSFIPFKFKKRKYKVGLHDSRKNEFLLRIEITTHDLFCVYTVCFNVYIKSIHFNSITLTFSLRHATVPRVIGRRAPVGPGLDSQAGPHT